MNKKILSILLITLSLTVLTACGKDKKKTEQPKTDVPPTVINTEEEVVKDQSMDVLTFTNTSLVYENGLSTLTTEIKNTSTENKKVESLNITIKDKEGKEMEVLQGYVDKNLAPGETTLIISNSTSDLSQAGKVEYSYR